MTDLTWMMHRLLRRAGFDLIRYRESQRISGMFPPLEEIFRTGSLSNYCIHDGYRPRKQAAYCDQTASGDLWQKEVYAFAREVLDQHALHSVADIGCGSGYKLMHYFGATKTIGLDVGRTCEQLRRTYPQAVWREADFAADPGFTADLVIAADVIEHLPDPDQLLAFIPRLDPQWIVISTPERNLLLDGAHDGPPRNPCHVREWSFMELQAYLGTFFEILEHFVCNARQCTQCVLCRPRRTKWDGVPSRLH